MTDLPVSIFCPYCKRYTALTTAPGKSSNAGYYAVAVWDVGDMLGTIWWIGICNYCKSPVLVRNNGDTIYPSPLPSPTDERIPEPIRRDLNEAKTCISIDAFRACAVMARRAMQTACINKGATKDNLVEQLQELASSGIITKDLKEWADVVRWVGNDAAHPNKESVLKEDAEDILKLAEQFLHVIYVAPSIAKEQRSKRKK